MRDRRATRTPPDGSCQQSSMPTSQSSTTPVARRRGRKRQKPNSGDNDSAFECLSDSHRGSPRLGAQLSASQMKQAAQCGACLLDISADDLDGAETTADGMLEVFGFSRSCSHAFHSSCIRKWLKRDSSCPLCKSDINCIVFYSATGAQIQEENFATVRFCDTLTSSESEEEPDISAISGESQRVTNQRRRRTRHPRAHSDAAQQRRFVDALVDAAVNEEKRRAALQQRLRESILLERRRLSTRMISPDQAKSRIEAHFARMPYYSTAAVPKHSEGASTSRPGVVTTTAGAVPDSVPPCDSQQPKGSASQQLGSRVSRGGKATVIPLTRVPKFLKPIGNATGCSGAGFQRSTPKYATDFLLGSSSQQPDVAGPAQGAPSSTG